MKRTMAPSTIARILEISTESVVAWIRKKQLPALNISSTGRRPTYKVYVDDLAVFLLARGLQQERVDKLLNLTRNGTGYHPVTTRSPV